MRFTDKISTKHIAIQNSLLQEFLKLTSETLLFLTSSESDFSHSVNIFVLLSSIKIHYLLRYFLNWPKLSKQWQQLVLHWDARSFDDDFFTSWKHTIEEVWTWRNDKSNRSRMQIKSGRILLLFLKVKHAYK